MKSLTLLHPSHTDVLRGDAALLCSPAVAAVALSALLSPVLRGLGEGQLVAQLTSAAPAQGLGRAVVTFLAAEALAPPLASAASEASIRLWQHQALGLYDRAYLHNEGARPALWAMGEQPDTGTQNVRQVRTHLFAERLRWGVLNEVKAIAGVMQATLALGYSALWFANTLGKDASMALLVGVVLACGYRACRLASESVHTEAARDAGREVLGHRARAWDNVVLGNVNNRARWQQRHLALTQQQDRLRACEVHHKQTSGAVEHLLALAPLTALFYQQLVAANGDARQPQQALTGLLLLPVAFRAAKEATRFTQLFTAELIPARKSLLERTLAPARRVPGCDFDRLIDFDRIFAWTTSGSHSTLAEAQDELIAAAQDNVPALFELRGHNGAGKSLFLLKLKQLLPADAAALLPPDKGGMLFGPQNGGSSSETNLHNFEDTVSSGAPVLLLDELEATLDGPSRAALRQRLRQLATPSQAGGGGRTIFLTSHV